MAAGRKLSRLLVLSHVGLVLLLAALLLAAGANTIHGAIQDRARAQVTQAAADALARLEDQRRDVGVVAGLLTERPTLHGYLRAGRRTAAREFVDTFRQTARVDYLQVERGGAVFAEAGTAPPHIGQTGLQVDPGGKGFWLVQAQPMLPAGDARVVVARHLPGQALATGNADERIRLHPVATPAPAGATDAGGVAAALRHVGATRVAETIGPVEGHAALRIEPVRASGGRIEALLAVSIPREAVLRDTLGWLAGFALGCAAAATLAAVLGAWLARRIARPFGQLARSAERLGVGDLETPVEVPATELAEPLALARSLDGMRRQLRALAERERQQRQELDMVLDGVDDGIVAVDEAQMVRYANRSFLRLVCRGEPEVLGRPFAEVLLPLPPESGAIADATVADPLQLAREHRVFHGTAHYLVRGHPRRLVVRSTAPFGERQVAIVREETSTEAARAMRDSILANLSHEFQTPLAAQIASIELLRDHLHGGSDAVATRLVESQFRGALRLSQLVDNLLDSVRIESGEMRLRREPVDLPALVRDAVELMRPLTAQRDQHVHLDLPTNGRRLLGDPQRLSQVAVNLLANANKFAPDQSSIWVELAWADDSVALWVEDEGPGLPPLARRADLFAPFRRAPDEEPWQRGTGLGLAIVRALVERHDGEVVLAEPRHRKGARFGVVLPLEPVA
ncbi:MAG TPA: ATP-binding protein [Luteimonas sp.]|nr:ATP-binding protein [Luteimonas sp.]